MNGGLGSAKIGDDNQRGIGNLQFGLISHIPTSGQ
jgi:hypothetical protein